MSMNQKKFPQLKKYFQQEWNQYIYFLSADILFNDYWGVFLQEAYDLYIIGMNDIASEKFTKVTILYLTEGELPDYAERVKIKTCNDKKYLIFSHKCDKGHNQADNKIRYSF